MMPSSSSSSTTTPMRAVRNLNARACRKQMQHQAPHHPTPICGRAARVQKGGCLIERKFRRSRSNLKIEIDLSLHSLCSRNSNTHYALRRRRRRRRRLSAECPTATALASDPMSTRIENRPQLMHMNARFASRARECDVNEH